MEASYNGGVGMMHNAGPKLTLKGENSFNGNSGHGFESKSFSSTVIDHMQISAAFNE